MLNRKTVLTIFVIVVAIAALLWPKLRGTGNNQQLQAAKPTATALPVRGYVLQPMVLDNKVETSGSIVANEEVNLTSEASGKVVGLYFQEGTRVNKGQLLAQLNDNELRAQLQKAQSQRALYKAQEYRQKVLLEKQAVSQQEYEMVNTQLQAVESDIDLIKAQLQKTQIWAPFDGTIGLRRVSEGAYVSPGTIISTLQNIDQVKIEFSVPEKYSSRIRTGEQIIFRVRSSEKEFNARIFAIEPRIDPTTRNITMRALCPNPGGALVPGAFADVELILERLDSALLIPTEALVPELNSQKVFVKKNDKADVRVVQTGVRTRDKIQVIGGLVPGDTVLTTGILQMKPGAAIRVTQMDNPPTK